jgi:1-deoxy-D-xylulose-5-phosphate synthase
MIIYAPKDEIALRNIMYTAQLGLPHPIAIRYPRGRGVTVDWKQSFQKITIGKGHCIQKGKRMAILSIGTVIHNAIQATKDNSNSVSIYDMGFLKPIDTDLLDAVFNTYEIIITLEDGTIKGGLGSIITDYAFAKAYKGTIKSLGIPDRFIEHGTTEELQEEIGISPKEISKVIDRHQ